MIPQIPLTQVGQGTVSLISAPVNAQMPQRIALTNR